MAQRSRNEDILSLKRTDEFQLRGCRENGANPQMQKLIEDALEAIKWAYVFADYASVWVADRWVEQSRQNTSMWNPELCRDLYEAAGLKLVLEMLAGATFTEATGKIIEDREWWTEFNQEWRSTAKRKWQEAAGQ